jgi:hypothetical protein
MIFRRCDHRSGEKKSGYFHQFYAAARTIPTNAQR